MGNRSKKYIKEILHDLNDGALSKQQAFEALQHLCDHNDPDDEEDGEVTTQDSQPANPYPPKP